MPGRKSRDKGARGEREWAAFLSRVFRVSAHRGRQYHGGPESPDVVVDLPGLHFEVKRCEKLSLYRAMDQADDECGPDSIPVVAHRRNNEEWLWVCYAKDVPELVRRLQEAA